MTARASSTHDLRVFATLDTRSGKVSQRVQVLVERVDDEHPGLLAVIGAHPLEAAEEHPLDGTDRRPTRGERVMGWVPPTALRDWYRPDRLSISRHEAAAAGITPGLFADTRARGRVRIADPEGHLGPDGRPAFRALTASSTGPTLDAPLPRDEVVRLVTVETDDPETADASVTVVSRPVAPVLPPGLYPDHAGDLPGLPARPAARMLRVRAFVVADGARHEVTRVDEQAHTVWVERDGRSVPFAVSAFGPDLFRYTAEPA